MSISGTRYSYFRFGNIKKQLICHIVSGFRKKLLLWPFYLKDFPERKLYAFKRNQIQNLLGSEYFPLSSKTDIMLFIFTQNMDRSQANFEAER